MSLREALNSKAIFQHECPHLVSDYVNEHIGNHSITLQGQKTGRASLWHRALDPAISLSKITYGSRVRVRSPELQDIYHLQVVLNGQCRWQLADSERVLGPGELMMLNPQENVDLTYSEECEKIIIKIPRTIITNTAISHGASIPRDGVKFARHVLHINQFKALSQLLELLCLEAESEVVDVNMHTPYQILLANKLLSMFNSNVDIHGSYDMNVRCFEIIDSYIQDNIKKDVSVEELASVSRVSKRTLYNLFAKYRSITPMSYIKQKKLSEVRRLLQTKEGAIRNVTEVAMDYGFIHLGRFSGDYKKTFGELPSETLRKTIVA
ncbi:MAG: AraC family transcriptional regulator [Alteromonas sp.]|nr:AraC family transcriptional regulator [Alteromonas sp.]